MMPQPNVGSILGVFALVTGCAYSTVPVRTQVLDAATGRRVAGAVATIWPANKPGIKRQAAPDSEGRIEVPSFTAWDWRPGDPGLDLPVRVQVRAPGYAEQEVEYCCGSAQPPILLHP